MSESPCVCDDVVGCCKNDIRMSSYVTICHYNNTCRAEIMKAYKV